MKAENAAIGALLLALLLLAASFPLLILNSGGESAYFRLTIDEPRIPVCAEDAVLVGYGDFDPERGWERYECGPSFDDYSPSN